MDWKLISLSGVLLIFHAGALPTTRCDHTGAQECIHHMQTALDQAYRNMTHFCSVRDDVMADARACVTARLQGCPLQTIKQMNDSLNGQIDGYMQLITNCFRVVSPCNPSDLTSRAVQIKDCFLDVLEDPRQEKCSSVEEASQCAHDYATGCKNSMIFYRRLREECQRITGCGPHARTTATSVPMSCGLPCSSERFRICPSVNDRYGNDDTTSILQDVTALAAAKISNVTNTCRRWQNSSETLKCLLEVAQRCNMITFTVSNVDALIQRLESRCARETKSLLSDETGAVAADIMPLARKSKGKANALLPGTALIVSQTLATLFVVIER